MSISAVTGEMSQDLGRSPTPREIADKLGVTVEEVMEGIESANAYSTLSLDAGDSHDEGPASSMLDSLGMDDAALAHVEIRESIKPLIEQLPAAREADPAAPVLPRDDPVADRRGDRRLPDARLPAAQPHARAAAQLADRGQLSRVDGSGRRAPGRRSSVGAAARPARSTAATASAMAIGRVAPSWKFQASPSQISWESSTGPRAQGRTVCSPQAHSEQPDAVGEEEHRRGQPHHQPVAVEADHLGDAEQHGQQTLDESHPGRDGERGRRAVRGVRRPRGRVRLRTVVRTGRRGASLTGASLFRPRSVTNATTDGGLSSGAGLATIKCVRRSRTQLPDVRTTHTPGSRS